MLNEKGGLRRRGILRWKQGSRKERKMKKKEKKKTFRSEIENKNLSSIILYCVYHGT